jgi:hypothetical protein
VDLAETEVVEEHHRRMTSDVARKRSSKEQRRRRKSRKHNAKLKLQLLASKSGKPRLLSLVSSQESAQVPENGSV